MLDINFIRDNKELVKKAVLDKNSKVDVDHLLEVDQSRRSILSQIEELRQRRNLAAKSQDIEAGKEVKNQLEKLEPELDKVNQEFNQLMIYVPNVPFEDVPVGKDESENVVLRSWGEPTKFDFTPKDHIELGESLGLIDSETAGKVTGARFTYLKNEAVMLEFGLIQLAMRLLQDQSVLDTIASQIGESVSPKPFVPILPPMMIRPEVYIKMARLDPDQAEERYHLQNDELYLIGSAEHTLGPIHMDQTLAEKDLPIRYVGFSTSFRREAGSYGKDTRGIIRLHQFDKIEMESFTLAENSAKEQEFIVAIQEHLMQQLQIPYQVILICTGDLGGPDARQFDINSWMPGQNAYRETHTSDLMTDYQSRRLNTKVKRADGTVELVHMNDATAFAIGRTLVAILENYQQADGSVKVPEVLIPYTGFSEIKPKE